LGFEALRAFPSLALGSASRSAAHHSPCQTTPTTNEGNAMNNITLTGRLTQDPELRTLTSGGTVCRLRLAVNGMGRGGRDEPGYINVSAFGNAGEAAARVLTKGWLVAVDGRLQYGEWQTEDNSKRHDYEIVGNVEFLAAPRSDNAEEPATVAAGQEEIAA
jgi:single-strand DNA-binding protein